MDDHRAEAHATIDITARAWFPPQRFPARPKMARTEDLQYMPLWGFPPGRIRNSRESENLLAKTFNGVLIPAEF